MVKKMFKPTDLAAIQHVETGMYLWYLAADYTRLEDESSEKMDINVDNTTYNIAMNHRFELSMDLKEAMHEALRQVPKRTIYKNPMVSESFKCAQNSPDMPVCLSIIAMVLSTLTFLFTFYTCCRSDTIATALMSGMMRGMHAQSTELTNHQDTELPMHEPATTPLTFMVNPSVHEITHTIHTHTHSLSHTQLQAE